MLEVLNLSLLSMVSLKHEISLSSNFDLSSRKFIHTSLFHHEQVEKVSSTNKHTKCEVHDSFCQYFFFFLYKKRELWERKQYLQRSGVLFFRLLIPPESGYHWWNISYYFPKKHCRDLKDLFFFINYQLLQQRKRQLLEGISDNAETHPNFPWASTQPLILLETYLSPLFS